MEQIIQKKNQFVGNKAKGRISKRVFQENKTRQIFQKTTISYPLTHAYYRRIRLTNSARHIDIIHDSSNIQTVTINKHLPCSLDKQSHSYFLLLQWSVVWLYDKNQSLFEHLARRLPKNKTAINSLTSATKALELR